MCGWSKMRSGDRLCILISTLSPPWGFSSLSFPWWHMKVSMPLSSLDFQLFRGRTESILVSCCHNTRHEESSSSLEALPQPQCSFPGAPATTTMWPAVPACPFPSPLGLLAPVLLHTTPHLALPSSQSSYYCPKLSSCAAFMKLPLLSPFLSKWLDKWNLKRQHWRLFLGGRKWKSWLKSWSHHFMANRWGNSSRVSIFGLQNDCRWWLLLLRHFGCVWLCNPIDGSPPGSPTPGILQGVGAISFSRWWLQPWNLDTYSLEEKLWPT